MASVNRFVNQQVCISVVPLQERHHNAWHHSACLESAFEKLLAGDAVSRPRQCLQSFRVDFLTAVDAVPKRAVCDTA